MKQSKRFLILIMVLAMLFIATSCNKKEDVVKEATMDLTKEATTDDKEEGTTEEKKEEAVTEAEEVSIETLVADYFANKPDHSYMIAQDKMVERVANGDDVVIVDIRQADAYAEGHLKGAVNLPWGSAIAEGLASIPQDKEVFIYCYSGLRLIL